MTLLNDIDDLTARAGSHLSYGQWQEIIQDRVNQFADGTTSGSMPTSSGPGPHPQHASPGWAH